MDVAVIPARGGSKRIPGKNIRNFCGRPLIEYSINAARQAGVFGRVIVSTDTDEIARIASQAGAEVPFTRPSELSDDFTPTADVLLHALAWLEAQGCSVDALCCIYATAPMISAEDIRQGRRLLAAGGASAVIAVTGFDFPIFRAFKASDDGRLAMIWPEHELTRSNDLPRALHDAGQFYWLDAPSFVKNKKIYADDAVALVIPRHRVQDIDTPEDWLMAEALYNALRQMGQQDTNGGAN